MNFKIGDVEPIHGKDFKIVSSECIKQDIYLITCKVIKKNGELGKKTAMFFSDKRITSLKIYRS